MKNLYPYIGLLIIGTSIMHLLMGLLYYCPIFIKLMTSKTKDDKLFPSPNDNHFLLWFEISGLALLLIGVLIDWLIRTMHLQLPFTYCIGILLLGALATIFAPKSGSWLILIQAIVLLVWR